MSQQGMTSKSGINDFFFFLNFCNEPISQSKEKWMADCFVSRFIVSHIFQAKIINMSWFQFLQCQDCVLFIVVCHRKWDLVGFTTVGWTKEAFWRRLFWKLWRLRIDWLWKVTGKLVENENHHRLMQLYQRSRKYLYSTLVRSWIALLLETHKVEGRG